MNLGPIEKASKSQFTLLEVVICVKEVDVFSNMNLLVGTAPVSIANAGWMWAGMA